MQAESRIALVSTQLAVHESVDTDRLRWPRACEQAASVCPHSCDFVDRAVDVQKAFHSSLVKGLEGSRTHAVSDGKDISLLHENEDNEGSCLSPARCRDDSHFHADLRPRLQIRLAKVA